MESTLLFLNGFVQELLFIIYSLIVCNVLQIRPEKGVLFFLKKNKSSKGVTQDVNLAATRLHLIGLENSKAVCEWRAFWNDGNKCDPAYRYGMMNMK